MSPDQVSAVVMLLRLIAVELGILVVLLVCLLIVWLVRH